MANHYYQIRCNSKDVFVIPFRCTTHEAAIILNQYKHSDSISLDGVELPEVKTEIPIGMREYAVLDEVPPYLANEQIKYNNALHANYLSDDDFDVTENSIKQAYRECGAKLTNIKDAKELISLILDNSSDIKNIEDLCNAIKVYVDEINQRYSSAKRKK